MYIQFTNVHNMGFLVTQKRGLISNETEPKVREGSYKGITNSFRLRKRKFSLKYFHTLQLDYSKVDIVC